MNELESRKAAPLISVVFSFYNEAAVLPELLLRCREVFRGLVANGRVRAYELIFVNDNSSDASERLLRAEVEKGDVVLLNMSRNFGVSECVMAGMAEARGDAVIYLDADLQDPPEIIPRMVEAWQNDPEAEVVFTTRTRRQGESALKLLITKVGYRFINAISEIQLHVDSGDFKLLSRKVVNHLLDFREDRPYVRGLVSWIGYKQVQVFYERDARFDGRENTKMPVLSRRVLYYWLDRALISFSDAPLKIILFLGLVISTISLLYIIVVLIQKVLGWYTPGWPALMSAILLLGGVQMMVLGFVGLYVGSIFREVKRRPGYIVKDIYRRS